MLPSEPHTGADAAVRTARRGGRCCPNRSPERTPPSEPHVRADAAVQTARRGGKRSLPRLVFSKLLPSNKIVSYRAKLPHAERKNKERSDNMKSMKRILLLMLTLAIALSLSACGIGGPEMPMEFTIDGHTVALGTTTTGEMAGWGWDVAFTGSQNEIREDAKYVACYYTVSKAEGSGNEFWVTVYVPFQKNVQGDYVDFSAEEKQSLTEGVVCRVSVRKDASRNFDISYNGANLQDITWAKAEEWGAKEDESAYPKTCEMDAAQGSLKFKKSYTDEEMGELTVTMNTNAFAKLQK